MPSPYLLLADFTGSDVMVVVTSITLVFAMLVALCFVVTGEGKLFDRLTARKKQKGQAALSAAAAPSPAPVPAAPAAPAAPAPAPVPAAEEGIPGAVVAAITAAVWALEGEGTVVHGIRRLPAGQGSRRGVWGDAGVAQNVRPF